jgi:inner membrane transporter RhtA
MSDGQHSPSYAVLAALVLVVSQFSNALGAAWSKSLFAAVGPEGMIALRIGFSAILLGVFTRVWRLRVKRDQLGNLVVYGLALGLMSSVAYQAYARIPIGIVMAIETTGPLALVIYHSRRRSDFAWAACTVAGLALLLLRGPILAAVDPVGVAFAFCSAVFWASYIVFGKRVSTLGGSSIVAAGMGIASILVVPFGIASAGTRLLSGEWLITGLAIAVLSSTLPFLVQLRALRELPSRVYSLIASGVPAVGAITAFLVLGEALELRQCLGILLVMLASGGAVLGISRSPSMPILGKGKGT